MMKTDDIPTHEWVPFLDDFSRRHAGERVTIEVMSREFGVLRQATDQPLLGVSVDLRDGSEVIAVSAGDSSAANLVHAVTSPTSVQVARGAAGEDQALQLLSDDGTTTLLRLRPAGNV